MNGVKKVLIDLSKKNVALRRLMRKVQVALQRARYLRHAGKRVDAHQICFESFQGRKYADSPKAIYEYLLRTPEYREYHFVWFFHDPEKYRFLEANGRTRVVSYGSSAYYAAYATSKYWFTNSRIPGGICVKRNQNYVQCWHGTPLKRLCHDIAVEGANAMNSPAELKEKYDMDTRRYTYMLSPSAYCTEKFFSAFHLRELGKSDIIVEEGYPRNDYLRNYSRADVEQIKARLGLALGEVRDKKIILYAPTWRDNQHESGVGYVYQPALDFDRLRAELGGEYVILFRAHYHVADNFNFREYEGFLYDVSGYDDVNELYVIADLLITDYSSVFFDYAILERPMIFYMYDLEEYQGRIRDFYIGLEELPGPVVTTEDDLLMEIRNTAHFEVTREYKDFNNKYTYLDDGQASMRVVRRIIR